MIALLAPFLFSCERKCTSTDGILTNNELSWVSYTGSEILVFKNLQGITDTLRVGSRLIQNNAGTTEDNPCKHTYQSLSIDINDQAYLDLVSFGITISHHDTWNHGQASVNQGSHTFSLTDFTPQNNILINGNLYNSVYIMSIDTSGFSVPAVWKIYYTKSGGILKYEFTQGDVWEKIN